MLYFVSKELALGYLLFSFLSALGVLQLVAAHYRLVGLAFWDVRAKGSLLRGRRWGYGLGFLLVVGSAVWFFVSQWAEIFAPGPAGAELSLLFGTGAACALVVTLIVASLRQRLLSHALPLARGEQGQKIALGHTAGYLYIPSSLTAPMPAVCLVPGLGASEEYMSTLARYMVEAGLVALVISLDEGSYTYPEILAVLPAATSLLRKRTEVDPLRIGALGYDLGGDLVIRAASVDKQIKAVAALAPVLIDAPSGLDLLGEMSYPQALRWARNHKRDKLRKELDALAYSAKIAPRPFLLLYGAEDKLVVQVPAEKWDTLHRDAVTLKVIQGAGHLNMLDHPMVLRAVSQWFQEHL